MNRRRERKNKIVMFFNRNTKVKKMLEFISLTCKCMNANDDNCAAI